MLTTSNLKKVFLIALLCIGIAIYFFSKSEGAITNYPSSGTDIIAFGDSLVEGVGASTESRNFVSRLSVMIGRPIINLGVSGNTTEDGLKRLSQLDNYKPKVVLLLLGGNDHLRKVPTGTIFANLGKLIEEIHKRGAVVVLLGVRGNILIDRFDSEFEELRDKYHTAYVEDVLQGLFGIPQYMADSIHPNDLGYEKIAERIEPVLKKVIK